MIEDVKSKALREDVPIIKDGGLAFILNLIKERNVKDILELGTAVGYSSMNMARLSKDIKIDTLEKNPDMYNQAIANIENEGLNDQITVHFGPIEDFSTDKMYDLIFVDAAKAQYGKYTEQFLNNLREDGVFVYDNMVFHGMIYDVENIKGRGTRAMVRKIIKFRENMLNDERFDIMYYDEVGDGLLIAYKKKNER
ncbi:MAG: class I SAM-dependent methyltransferase [Erysipelotrichaceae bacterium]|nr:class I SAM-dependent methyltransferase [Erysipelotrichaceae bacterium]